MKPSRFLTIMTVVAIALASLVGCSPTSRNESDAATSGIDSTGSGPVSIFPDSQVGPTISSLPHRSVSPLPQTHLAKGLIPPTNRWYSGLAFGPSQNVFPLPLSFGLTTTGFTFGLPTVDALPNVITGAFTPAVTVDPGAASTIISAYDDVSVTLEFRSSDGTTLGHTTIAEGSPLVGFTAEGAQTLVISAGFQSAGSTGSAGAGLWTNTIDGQQYAMIAPAGSLDTAGTAAHLAAGQSIQWFPVPSGSTATAVASSVSGVLTSVGTGYATSASTATTTLRYNAVGGKTVFGALPHQTADLHTTCRLGEYHTIYGTMKLCGGSQLSWSVPAVKPSNTLDLASVTSSDLAAIATQVKKDANTNSALPTDTYGGGKALYRLANLLTLANQLKLTSVAGELRTRLQKALDQWTEPTGCETRQSNCFVYDPAAHGIVGLVASFGSDQFNDHHFHYGYFFYAASVLATEYPSTIAKLKPVMNLLAADLATSGKSTLFPERRVFDPYFGHSWASGFAPFGDGNNQESSSEAVNAWNGLALWASATHQRALRTEAEWMLSSEADSARTYWTNANLTSFSGFSHSVVAINWGGKRDYATWFSADPSAMLGIQLIPMNPASTYLAGDPARIRENIAEAAPGGFHVQFGDYMLMYLALAGGTSLAQARSDAKTLPDSSIDQADSRAYLMAWLASR